MTLLVVRRAAEVAGALLDGGFDPFSPRARASIEQAPGLASIATEMSTESFLTIVRTLAVDRSARPRVSPVELIATVPPYARATVRATGPVVRELLESARKEVVAAGYEVNDRDVLNGFVACARRETSVTLVCDRARGTATNVHLNWPADLRPPTIYTNREDPSVSEKASMHSKFLIIDGVTLLVTSANFTYLAHHQNIEFGVLVRGEAAASAREFVRTLIHDRVLEPCLT